MERNDLCIADPHCHGEPHTFSEFREPDRHFVCGWGSGGVVADG